MNISIRKYRDDDSDKFYKAVLQSIEETSNWLSWCDYHYNKEAAKKWVVETVPNRS